MSDSLTPSTSSAPATDNPLALPSGKMYQACFPIKPTPSGASWRGYLGKQNHLKPRKGSGVRAVFLPAKSERLPGECSTLNISECPSAAVASSLSQVLEPMSSDLQKYLLSSKACQGILRRSEVRGKKLPAMLEAALREQAATSPRGGAIAGTLDASYYKGCGSRNGKEREVVAVFEPHRTLNKDGTISSGCPTGGKTNALHTSSGNGNKAPVAVFNRNGSGDGVQVNTISAAGKPNDQGNVIVFEPGAASRLGGHATSDGKTPALRAHPGDNLLSIGQEVVDFGRTADRIYIDPDKSTTLSSQGGGMGAKSGLYALPSASKYIVRRLTPKECERLQGFPRGYTLIPTGKNKMSPDNARYKALGNSMAVPVMAWIGKRLNDYIQNL